VLFNYVIASEAKQSLVIKLFPKDCFVSGYRRILAMTENTFLECTHIMPQQELIKSKVY